MNDLAFENTEEVENTEDKQPTVETPTTPPVVENPAVALKQELTGGQGETVTSRTGIRVRFHPVSQNIIRGVQSKIENPPVPTQPHPNAPDDPTKFIENPLHPDYQIAIARAQEQRIEVSLDALFLFGMELLDPMPENDVWLRKLIVLNLVTAEEVKTVSIDQKELWYKKWIVASDTEIFERIYGMLGISEEGVKAARAAFKSNA